MAERRTFYTLSPFPLLSVLTFFVCLELCAHVLEYLRFLAARAMARVKHTSCESYVSFALSLVLEAAYALGCLHQTPQLITQLLLRS
jgi:hypothetical protein